MSQRGATEVLVVEGHVSHLSTTKCDYLARQQTESLLQTQGCTRWFKYDRDKL